MRKVIVSNLVSADGYIAGPDGDLSWFKVDDDFFEYAKDLLRATGVILFGRKTYEMMAAYWPGATTGDPVIIEKMNVLSKIVFSRTSKSATWNNSRLVGTDPAEAVAKLKLEAGGDIVIFGSGSIVSLLLAAGLVDDLRLFVNPTVLGTGTAEFQSMTKKVTLKLRQTRVFQTGVVMLAYEPHPTTET